MCNKVLAVTHGDYGDYEVKAIYTLDQREAADNYARLLGGEVEERLLNEPVPDDPGRDWYAVTVKRNGDTTVKTEPRLSYDGEKRASWATLQTHEDYPEYNRKSHWRLFWYGYAKSREDAIQSVNELRRQILAGQRPEGVNMGKN